MSIFCTFIKNNARYCTNVWHCHIASIEKILVFIRLQCRKSYACQGSHIQDCSTRPNFAGSEPPDLSAEFNFSDNTMMIILDGSSDIHCARVEWNQWFDLFKALILDWQQSNLIFCQQNYLFTFTFAQCVLSYHLIFKHHGQSLSLLR